VNIVTRYDPLPWSLRQFDWSAIDDDTHDEGRPVGYGRTEQEAVEDLMEQIEEREP